MKYPKRKDKYCSDVLNDNFREIDNRLVSLEKGGGGSGGVSNIEYLTQAAYDALPDTKLSNDVEYRITDSGTESVKASNVRYDNTNSMLKAVNVQGAVDELHNCLTEHENNSSQIYSTDEKKIGIWINGKPIYRKMTVPTDITVGEKKNVPLGISNMDELIKIYGNAKRVNGYQFNIPNTLSGYEITAYDVDATNNTFNYKIGSSQTGDRALTNVLFIFEYTKTTD